MENVVLQLRGLKLTVKGYEFPHLSDGSHDANWLLVDAAIRTDAGGLGFKSEPCLLTWELLELAQQLEWASAARMHPRWQVAFKPLEPYLRLHFSGDGTRTNFRARLKMVNSEGSQSHRVEWAITQEELDDFRQQLKRVNEIFPQKE